MFRFVVLLAFVATAFAAPSVEFGDVDVEVLYVDDVTKLDLPEGEIIPLQTDVEPLGVIRYTLGNRQSGDRMVAAGSDGRQWSSPQNIQLNLKYPNQGVGAVVTYVEIVVDQSSDVGRGYIIGGGIGQRSISIVIEAQSTTRFVYQASIYGI